MVNTNAKKITSFKRGQNPKMMKHVGTNMRTGFNDFVSDCLKQEKNNNVYAASRLVRELLSQVHPSLGPGLQIVPRIIRLPLVQGLGHPSGRVRMPSNLRGTRNHSRWHCHKRRQDKAVHLEL
jgi:hypothetical protein